MCPLFVVYGGLMEFLLLQFELLEEAETLVKKVSVIRNLCQKVSYTFTNQFNLCLPLAIYNIVFALLMHVFPGPCVAVALVVCYFCLLFCSFYM